MVNFSGRKEIIVLLKQVATEKGLTSVDKIHRYVENQMGEGVISRSTVARVFAEGSENSTTTYNYETTLQPLCTAILDIEHDEEDDTPDTLAYKSLLRYKKSKIINLEEEIESIKSKEKAKYAERLEKETKHFNDSLEFMKNQIALKDQRIDELLADVKEFLASNKELMMTNNRLVTQLMECPLRKVGDSECQ